VYAREELRLDGTESKQQLADTLLKKGADMIIGHLPSILDGTMQPAEQNESEATYSQLFTKEIGTMRPDEFTAEELERQVRAYTGFPKSRLDVGGRAVRAPQRPRDGAGGAPPG
jgi:methionyl-tRNA formyltransferase